MFKSSGNSICSSEIWIDSSIQSGNALDFFGMKAYKAWDSTPVHYPVEIAHNLT